MSLNLIDTHCHLDAKAFEQDFAEVLQRATETGVKRILSIGISRSSSATVMQMADKHPEIFPVVGIHPNYTLQTEPDDWDRIIEMAHHDSVVGVGETGLDRYWKDVPIEIQQDYFRRHIRLSRDTGKPFVVHCRDAETDVVELLQEESQGQPLAGVMHSFCGSGETAKICLQLGLHISFSGMLTYRRNEELRATAATIPLDRLLVETDAPYLAPQPRRGKRNEPAFTAMTNEVLAEVHGKTAEEMGEITTRNATALFQLH